LLYDMTRRRLAELPLHSGSAPPWLFKRMVDLAGAIGTLIVRDAGPDELLRRLSDPFWFQAFGCVLGFDWHSSGVTTTVCGALKEAARRCGNDLGLIVCGGKGATSRKTPEDIRRACDRTGDDAETLVRASKMSAKVDTAGVQDGYQLYHHTFHFVPKRKLWGVVQQGMNEKSRSARRYHWLSATMPAFVEEPHAAVACDRREASLNLVAGEAERHRETVAALAREHPDRVLREMRSWKPDPPMPLFEAALPKEPIYQLPRRHTLSTRDIDPSAMKKVLIKTYETQAADFESLLGTPGIGAQAMRSLSLLAEVIYNAPVSHRDPAAYSFAHGGKDGHPYAVNRSLYDANIHRLREAINAARIGHTDKIEAMKSLSKFVSRLR
jgi:hypothetical protein